MAFNSSCKNLVGLQFGNLSVLFPHFISIRYASIKTCLHTIPSSIEERGTEWPEVWPKRLITFPDWVNNREKLIAESEHWKAIVNNSYITGMGIDWSSIRNVMDMKAINGGYAIKIPR